LANHQKEQRKTFSSAVKYIQTEKHRKRYLRNCNLCKFKCLYVILCFWYYYPSSEKGKKCMVHKTQAFIS